MASASRSKNGYELFIVILKAAYKQRMDERLLHRHSVPLREYSKPVILFHIGTLCQSGKSNSI